MASLANQTISSTYDGLVKTSTDQPVPISGVQLLEDGVGNSLALSVGRANQGVTITGTLTATSISGVLADGVTATTQTLGDNSTKVATTAYVDAQVTASDLDFAGDSGTGAVDLDSQSLTIAGTANEIETSASGQTITIGLPSSVTVGTLTATTLAGTLSTAAQTNITSVGTLSSLAVSGNLTVDTNTLFVDAASNSVGIGTSSPATKIDISNEVNATAVGDSILTVRNTRVNTGSGASNIRFITNEVGGATQDNRAQIGAEYDGSNGGRLIFSTAQTSTKAITERMRIDSSGQVGIGGLPQATVRTSLWGSGSTSSTYSLICYNSGGFTSLVVKDDRSVSIGGDLSFNNGRGIDFSASAGGGATSSLLDDYEEGTFTPTAAGTDTIGSTTHTNQYGYYTKIGRQVSVTIFISWSALTGTGNLLIGGLPFTIGSFTENYPMGACITSGLNWSGGTYLQVQGLVNSQNMWIVYGIDDGNAGVQQCVNESANARISLTYFV